MGCATLGPVRTASISIQGPTKRPLTPASRHAGGGGATLSSAGAGRGEGDGAAPPKSAATRGVADRTVAAIARAKGFMAALMRAIGTLRGEARTGRQGRDPAHSNQ